MTDIITIPKIDDAWEIYPAWVPLVGGDDKPIRPGIMCKCGKLANIGNHHIHPGGELRASFYHHLKRGDGKGYTGCGWHVYLNLEGYDGPEFLPEDGKRYPL